MTISGSSPAELTASVFENAWAVATSKSATSDGLFASAINAVASPSVTAATLDFTPEVVEPNVTIPQDAEGSSLARYYEMSDAVMSKLATLFQSYITDYFPDDSAYFTEAQAWLAKAIGQGGTGLSPQIEAQIFSRQRSRILKESQRAENEVTTSWAARGYPLPPGAATAQVLAVRLDAMSKISDAARDLAIQQAQMELDNVKFAVQSAISLYGTAMGAACEYIKSLSLGYQTGAQIIPSITDSQSRLISAASEYYRARISVEDLRLRSMTPSAEFEQQARTRNADLLMAEISKRVDAAIEAAKAMGTQAASALNSLHVSAGVSGSSSNSVGYSYSNQTTSKPAAVTAI